MLSHETYVTTLLYYIAVKNKDGYMGLLAKLEAYAVKKKEEL